MAATVASPAMSSSSAQPAPQKRVDVIDLTIESSDEEDELMNNNRRPHAPAPNQQSQFNNHQTINNINNNLSNELRLEKNTKMRQKLNLVDEMKFDCVKNRVKFGKNKNLFESTIIID
jgi:hypothetical protein